MTPWPLALATPTAVVIECVVLVMQFLPWNLLLEARARSPSLCRWFIVTLCLLCLIWDYSLSSVVFCCLATACAAIQYVRHLRPAPGSRLGFWGLVLPGTICAALSAYFGQALLVRGLTCSWILCGLYLFGRFAGADRSLRPGTVRLILPAGAVLALSADGLSRSGFLFLMIGGAVGWYALAFLQFRQIRCSGLVRRPLIRSGLIASMMLGAVPAAIASLEAYTRFIYDASNANDGLRVSRRWAERHWSLNSWGFRDVEFEPLDRYDHVVRVVLLGDSFAFGQGINDPGDLLHAQLEAELNRTGGPDRPFRVFNLSRSGTGTADQIAIFREFGERLQPHVVVLAYYFNDIPYPDTLPHERHEFLNAWTPLMDASDFLELFIWQANLWGQLDRSGQLNTALDFYGRDDAFAAHAEDFRAWSSAVRQCGAVPIAVLFPELSAPEKRNAQAVATRRVRQALQDLEVPVVDVGTIVDVSLRRYHANPFDWHPSAELHAAVVPVLARRITQSPEE